MNSDTKVLRVYLSMILEGTAFDNWKNPPTKEQRHDLCEYIIGKEKSFRGQPLDIHSIQKIVTESQNTKQLKRLMDEMYIDEDEFKV